MKRYLVFAGMAYYPRGGMRDFIGDYDTELEATKALNLYEGDKDWFHIYDSQTKEFTHKRP